MLRKMARSREPDFDVAVVGGGAAGLAAALIATTAGFRTILFAPPAQVAPGRTAALLAGSIETLLELDVWPALAHLAAPLTAIRLVDATKRLVRAPETATTIPASAPSTGGSCSPRATMIAGTKT